MSTSRPLAVIKLGGSIATAEGEPGCCNAPLLARVAAEIARAAQPAILVHGTGVVGKPPARVHGYAQTGVLPPGRIDVVVAVRRELRALQARILGALIEGGLAVAPIALDDALFALAHAPDAFAARVRSLLDDGIAPVFSGDFAREPGGSWRVFSSDRVVVDLAARFAPDLVLFLSDVDGVLDEGGRVIPVLSPQERERMARRASDSADVSGGMSGKVGHALAAAEHARRCVIANGRTPGVAGAVLRGDDSGATRVVACTQPVGGMSGR